MVEDLVRRLTPEEKAGQLSTRALPPDGRFGERELEPSPGFVMVSAAHWEDSAARVRALQEQLAAAGSRGIPALVITLGTQSGAVRFLHGLARAATWDQGLAEAIGAATAFEARAGGAAARMGPVLAVANGPFPVATADRDQCLGGDPVLGAELVAAHVRGAQGQVPGRIRHDGCAVVLPHLGAIASQLSGRPAAAHERTMRDSILVAAQGAVAAGAVLVVPTSSANADVPGHVDSWLLREVLRRDWGFDGVVIAAPGALDGLVAEHRVAVDVDTSYALALEAGVDVVGSGVTGAARLARLVRQGKIPSWLLDDAVRAVLRLKVMLGLFEDAGPLDSDGRVGGSAHRELAHRTVADSLVLLSDVGHALPLAGVTSGSGARRVDVLWVDRSAAAGPDTAQLAAALASAMPDCVVRDRGGFAAADADDLADTVVVVVPGDPGKAATTVSRIVATGRRCVALVCSGDVDSAPALASTTAAVVLCWQPFGEHAGAVAEVLAGTAEPGGRLPLDLEGDASFPLGHGRGYTTFEYSQLQVTPNPTAGAEAALVQFRLTNSGRRAGKEVAQVYVRDPVSSIRTQPRRLVGFAAVRLAAGQSRRIRIMLPSARLAVWDRTMRQVVEPGRFDVFVGHSATDIRLTGTFTLGPGGEVEVPRPRSR